MFVANWGDYPQKGWRELSTIRVTSHQSIWTIAHIHLDRASTLQSNWDENGQTYFVQSDPLPATILSYVQEVEVGDDPD